MTQPRHRRERPAAAHHPQGSWWPEWAVAGSATAFVLGVVVVAASTDPARPHRASGPAEAGAALVLLAMLTFAVAAPTVLWRWWKARVTTATRPRHGGSRAMLPAPPPLPPPPPAAVPALPVPPGAGTSRHPRARPGAAPVHRPAAAGGHGFAVVDLETTGLHPAKDRVVEVAVIHLDANAEVTGEFSTLINPGRDAGPARLHGIASADIHDAPTFADAAPAVWRRLSGRVLVAHNVAFGSRFLRAEFARCGLRMPSPPVMCTMRLASSYLASLPARSLTACAAAAGVSLARQHGALSDARAAAGLLACYRRAHKDLPESWADALTTAAGTPWPQVPGAGPFRPVTRRPADQRPADQRPGLAGFTDRLPRGPGGDVDTYLGVLDRVLEDRILSGTELADLPELAAELGVARDAAQHATREYLQQVAAAAWRDGHLTSAERADLRQLTELLAEPAGGAGAVPAGARAAAPPPARPGHAALAPGDTVVFTGSMSKSRAELEALATAARLSVTSSVTERTALVVAADPCSRSGNAERARQLGVRMVTEQVFLYLLDRMRGGTVQAESR